MSYVKQDGLGLTLEDITAGAGKVASFAKSAQAAIPSGGGKSLTDYLKMGEKAISTVKLVLDDPALPEIMPLVARLHQLEQPKGLKGLGDNYVAVGAAEVPGIGLKRLVTPLKAYVKFRENPLIGYAALAAIIATPVLVGYALGKKAK